MYHKKKRGIWFGILNSKKGESVVVWDSEVPKASTGKVFLYNFQKEKITEYVEQIVQPKLRDLTKKEQRELQPGYVDQWQIIRLNYVPAVEDRQDLDINSDSSSKLKTELDDIGDDSLEIDEDLDEV